MIFVRRFSFLIQLGILLLPALCLAQGSVADSLIKLSQTPSLNDTVKFKLYDDILWELFDNDINAAMSYAKKGYELSKKINRPGYTALAILNLANVYNRRSEFDTALIYYNTALKIRRELGQEIKAANVRLNMAIVYARQSKFKEALENNFEALKVYEQEGDTGSQALVLSNIGLIYDDLERPAAAEKFYLRSLVLARKSKAIDEGIILLHIGSMKLQQAAANGATSKILLDSAMFYFTASEKLLQQSEDLFNLASLYLDMGKLYELKHDYTKAIPLFMRSLKSKEELEDKYGVGFVLINLGEAYLLSGDRSKAEECFQKSIAIFSEQRHYDNLKTAYNMMSKIAADAKDFDAALRYHHLYSLYSDSLYNSETAKHLAEMQTRYETEKKDLEIAKKSAELKTREEQVFVKNIIIVAVICILLLLAAAAYFFYRKKQLQQKAELDAERSRQKEMRTKAIVEAEEKERIRIATDLHDGVGQLLSAAKLNLSTLGRQIELNGQEQQTAFNNALTLVDDSVKEVRSVSHNMMPNTLLKLGLASAVKEFITKLKGTPNLKVNLEIVDLDQRLEQEKETVLYRVIQELVSNIIRHAKATELTLQLIRHEKELSIVIEDNGIGFDTAKLNEFGGIGLKNILSRVEFINGSIHFDSAIGRGTTVMIDIPVTV